MKRAGLLLLLWLMLCLDLPPAHAASEFDEAMAASVFSVALDFIVPRTLEQQGIPQLTVWGLRGLTALDPVLIPDLRENEMRLAQDGKPVFSAPLPATQTADDWGRLAATMAQAAFALSTPVRAAGTGGVIRSFFDEMFNHLDPYSRYVPPGAADTDRERRSGRTGLGLSLGKSGFAVRVVVPGSPADDAGIRPGDRIVSIDGHALRGEDTTTVEGWMAGQEGTIAQLTWRDRGGRLHRDDMERALVPPQTVMAQRLGDVLMIRIDGFSAGTDLQFAGLLDAGFAGHRIRGVVLDLRGNRGGLLREAASAVDQVMDAGIVATTAGRNPQASRVWPGGAGTDRAKGRPIIVLVDGRTASAAEIMAAALADNGRAVVVGSSTLGKGLVQTISPLPDGGELFVTWSRVLAPAGWPIQGLGVLPQICTSLGIERLRAQLDDLLHGQLDMAAALARHNAARAPLPLPQVVDLRNACPAAEGRDADLDAAMFLLDHPAAYQMALTKAGD